MMNTEKALTLEFVSKKEKDFDERHIVRTEYTIGGYTVIVFDTTYINEESRRSVECKVTQRGRNYLPEIYYHDGWADDEDSYLEISTASYGSLNVEEFKAVVEAQQMALEVVETLTRELGLEIS